MSKQLDFICGILATCHFAVKKLDLSGRNAKVIEI
jgi:hypothetical protein